MAASRLLADVCALMRRQRYSIHTERSYCDWIARYVKFHRMRSREELLAAGAAEVEVFLSYLAEELKVAPNTQNQYAEPGDERHCVLVQARAGAPAAGVH